MLSFRKATISDRAQIENYFNMTDRPSLEYSFTTLYLWQHQYGMEFCINDGFLYIRAGRTKKRYLFPIGSGDIKKAVSVLLDSGAEFYGLSEEQAQLLEKIAPDRYTFTETRDMGDYVYRTENLINLTGKKYRAKRNHINRFVLENPDWTYEEITEANISEVIQMHEIWCSQSDDADGLAEEASAVRTALSDYFALGFSGGLIRTGGKVVAFSVGDKLSDNMFLVHIEKALLEYNGAYQMINCEFAKHNCSDFEFTNREEDTGDEGLRKAKLSYRPEYIVKKFLAKRKG